MLPLSSLTLILTGLVFCAEAAPVAVSGDSADASTQYEGCGTDQQASSRHKRWARFHAHIFPILWPTNKPITLSVLNAPHGFTTSDIENIALGCAKVSFSLPYMFTRTIIIWVPWSSVKFKCYGHINFLLIILIFLAPLGNQVENRCKQNAYTLCLNI